MLVQRAIGMFEKVANGPCLVVVAPPGDAPVQRAPPGLRQREIVLIQRRGLFVRLGQLEFLRHDRTFPVHAPLLQHRDHFRAPVAVGFGLVIEEPLDHRPEISAKPVVVRLIHRLEIPVHRRLAGPVNEVTFPPFGAEGPGEYGNPASRFQRGVEPAVAQILSEVGKSVAVPDVAVHLSREHRHQVFRRDRHRPGGVIDGHFQFLAGMFRGHAAARFAARPPLLVEDPHIEVVALCRFEADAQVAEPALAQPVAVRARFGRETPVAAFRHLAHIHFQPLAALVAVQPEQGSGQSTRLNGHAGKHPLQFVNRRLRVRRHAQKRRPQSHHQPSPPCESREPVLSCHG